MGTAAAECCDILLWSLGGQAVSTLSSAKPGVLGQLKDAHGVSLYRYALVNPVPSTSHLQVAKEGLQLLESMDAPVAPIVVIGPYRSGKSFLLNQLLGVPCSKFTQAAGRVCSRLVQYYCTRPSQMHLL